MASTELDAIILARLQQTGATWSTLDAKLLTASDEKAFLLLTAGFVERRISVRMRMAGVQQSLDATITATGEHDLVEAMEGVLDELQTEIRVDENRWHTGRENHQGVVPRISQRHGQNHPAQGRVEFRAGAGRTATSLG